MYFRKHSRKNKIGAGPKKSATTRQREANLAIERKIREREVQERATALMRNRKEREREVRLKEARERFGIFEEPEKSSSNKGYYRDLYLSSSSENPSSSSSRKSSSSSSRKSSSQPNSGLFNFAKKTPKEMMYDRNAYKKLDKREKDYQNMLKKKKEELEEQGLNAFLQYPFGEGSDEKVSMQKRRPPVITEMGLGLHEEKDGNPKRGDYVLAYDLDFNGGKTRRRKRKRRTNQTRRTKRSRRRV